MSDKNNGLKDLLHILSGVCAFLTVAVYGILIIHGQWNFIPAKIYNVLVFCKLWAPLIVVALAGLEFTSGKSFLIKLIFYVLTAAVVISMFFPDVWSNFVQIVDTNVKK